MTRPPAVCVFCGSSDRVDPALLTLGEQTGIALGQRGWTLVYGGGSTGLMGRVARGCHAAGGHVVGVIPRSMADTEAAYLAADELVFTHTMRQRKHEMDERSDAFLVLPGGFGTLEELSEVITHRYLNFHQKPVAILNPAGFYNPLLELFDHFITHGFASPTYRHMWSAADTIDATLNHLAQTLHRPTAPLTEAPAAIDPRDRRD